MPPTTRRTYLKTTAAATALAVGSTTSNRATAATSGYLVITWDDGTSSDYTDAFPIHQDMNATAGTLAIPSDQLGESGYLTLSELQEMVNAGFEAASHTMRQRVVDEISLIQSATAGDTRIYVETNVHATHAEGHVGDDIVIEDDTGTSELATIAGGGSDTTGEYIDVETGIDNSYSTADNARERLPESRVERSIGRSTVQLRAEGFDVNTFIAPNNLTSERARKAITHYYTSLANYETVDTGAVNEQPINPITLRRTRIKDNAQSDSELQSWLDDVAAANGLGIISGHSTNIGDKITQQRVRDTIKWARDRNLKVTTIHQALTEMDVVDTPYLDERTVYEEVEKAPENNGCGYVCNLLGGPDSFPGSLFADDEGDDGGWF